MSLQPHQSYVFKTLARTFSVRDLFCLTTTESVSRVKLSFIRNKTVRLKLSQSQGMSSLVPLQISPELNNTYRIIKLFLSSDRDFPLYLVFSSFTAQIAGLLFLWFSSLSPSKHPFMWVLSVGYSDFSLPSISTFKFLPFWYLKTCSLSFFTEKRH